MILSGCWHQKMNVQSHHDVPTSGKGRWGFSSFFSWRYRSLRLNAPSRTSSKLQTAECIFINPHSPDLRTSPEEIDTTTSTAKNSNQLLNKRAGQMGVHKRWKLEIWDFRLIQYSMFMFIVANCIVATTFYRSWTEELQCKKKACWVAGLVAFFLEY